MDFIFEKIDQKPPYIALAYCANQATHGPVYLGAIYHTTKVVGQPFHI